MFFDDILIYSSSWEEHLSYLQLVLQLMQDNSLHANLKKCSFGVPEIHYLGHTISADGVHTEEDKIASIRDWPVPTTLKQLRGFLGLTGYYRHFIKDYGIICRPLTMLLRKDSSSWTTEAQSSFQLLKNTMITPPVLALPNFEKPFVIETDASGTGMGDVLMQEGHPIAFISKEFSEKNALLSAYERELLALVFAVNKWQHYLMNLPFVFRTDQQSLKFLLDHKMATPFQQKWLSKLAGFDFTVEYKCGSENRAVDALSRIPSTQLFTMAVSSIHSQLMSDLQRHWNSDTKMQQIIGDLQDAADYW